jgi:CheY-like chemotaxis protein
MALILAIEPDKKQASAVRALARGSLAAQIVVADSTARGLQELDGRLPDLILTSLLLSPKDETALDEHLRGLDTEGHRVPTLVIPVLAAASRSSKSGGLLKRLKKPRKTTGTEACDPATFAAQITEYLDRAAAERELDEDEDDDELPIAALPPRAPLPPLHIDETHGSPAHATPMPVGRILFSTSDVTSINEGRSVGIAPEAVHQMPTVALDGADEGRAWDEIPLEAIDASLEIIADPIDLNAFVEELEAVVSSYGKTIVIEPASEIERSSEPITAPADPPLGLATLYAWPALEGVPAGMDWETTRPGDPDYEILAEFIEAFESPTTAPAPSAADPISDETVLVDDTPVSSPQAVDRESWVSLSMRTRYNWPPLEGVESLAFAAIEAEGPAPRIEIAVPVPAPALPAPPAAQWLEILTAIRRDIQELRAEHRAEILAESDDSTKPASVTPGSSAERPKAKAPQATQAPAAPARKRKRKIPPKQDEWGFFDPDQCGFAALLAKLEEIEGDA